MIQQIDPGSGKLFEVKRWTWGWWKYHLWSAIADVVGWFDGLRYYWVGFKVGVRHGHESPACGLSHARIELRFDDVRGEHWYCCHCLRPIDK